MSEEQAAEVTTESAPVEGTIDGPAAIEEAPATSQAADKEESATSAPEVTESEKFNQRAAKLTKEAREAQRERDDLQRRLDTAEAKLATPEIENVPALPKEEDFDWDEGKYKAAVDNRDAVIARNARVEGEKTAVEKHNAAVAQNAQNKRADAFAVRFDDYAAKAPGFEASADIATHALRNAGAREAILDDDKGPAILAHIAANLDVADRLNSLSPYAAAREIGKLSATLSAEPIKPKTSAAPEPVTTLGGGGALSDELQKYDVGGTFE